MEEFRKPYLVLFNGVTDALDALRRNEYRKAEEILIQAQQNAEEAFIEPDGTDG